mmetsp:Transcript_11824/g.13425  ORF Transcript_11824/g.13425 Transcript_11824/m.13425 type:complete len:768 (-) Transcript_11824:17-2320(-)
MELNQKYQYRKQGTLSDNKKPEPVKSIVNLYEAKARRHQNRANNDSNKLGTGKVTIIKDNFRETIEDSQSSSSKASKNTQQNPKQGGKQRVRHNKVLTQSIQEGYDSSLTSSASESELRRSSVFVSDASSCVLDEDEGTMRKPNELCNYNKVCNSDEKTANDSEYLSQRNFRPDENNPNEQKGGIEINSSWEVLEGSSVVIEVESSLKQNSSQSDKNQSISKNTLPVEPFIDRGSKKSSETLTARFASYSKNESKQREEEEVKPPAQSRPLHKAPVQQRLSSFDSEDEGYDSEKDQLGYKHDSRNDNRNQRAVHEQRSGKEGRPRQINETFQNNSLNHRVESNSEANNSGKNSLNDDNVKRSTNESGNKKAPQSVKEDHGKGAKNDSQISSQQFGSVSTRTSPVVTAKPEVRKRKVDECKYVSKKDFKSFLENVKTQASTKPPKNGATRKRWASPLKIVDKLVEDANRRLQDKRSNVHKARDPSFAQTVSGWNNTLRAKSQQPKSQDRSQIRSHKSIQGMQSDRSQNFSLKREISEQRVKKMLERFEVQDKLKKEILERERQLRRIENLHEEEELKNNVHDRYLKTKFKEANGHSSWSRTHSEEVVERMYNRVYDKQEKLQQYERENSRKREAELKTFFKPTLVAETTNLFRNDSKIKNKLVKVQLQKEQKKKNEIKRIQNRFDVENQNNVYHRMQKDLEQRRVREEKRANLKRLKDLHYQHYRKLVDEEDVNCLEEPQQKLRHYKSRDELIRRLKRYNSIQAPEQQ